MNSNTRTGNWSAFGGGGGRSGGFGRQATNDTHTSAFGGGGGGRDSAAWGAFGGQRDERAEQRKREREAEAAREAAAARAKKVAEEAEAKKLADAQNFKSTESYPALGGGPAKATASKMNWGAAAKLGITRAAEREAEERAAAALDRGSRFETIYTTRARPPPVTQRAASHDYEEEEEPDYEEDTYAPRERERQRMAYAGDDGEEDDGEFNADIVSGRRRGDKGIW